MGKKKLKLSKLEVNSFITKTSPLKSKTYKGGGKTDPSNNPACSLNCLTQLICNADTNGHTCTIGTTPPGMSGRDSC